MSKTRLTKKFNTSASTLWSILTEAKYSPDYMFNCTLKTSWEVGEDITWQGEYQGYKAFQQGKVLAFEPIKTLSYSTFDPNTGLNDEAINYIHVTYILSETDGHTELVIENETFDGNEQRMEHIQQGWLMVLDNLEQLIRLK
ncbi:SRPBCC domain-containing protein [Thalassotalea marina]|uniref:Activator of Hsp90 ATPase homologue 1/2-like C-terminal domain-containing protein n=1 Tax=Thalassotalea marina TaxID=1673741 RepID=A0A919BJ47_9GAMM|nr:SRPBCC domain-containing protein [Thalassotalea marina]GHF94042.1 hypothetical protein GCM10017161_22850 [Thalassotalea marina]